MIKEARNTCMRHTNLILYMILKWHHPPPCIRIIFSISYYLVADSDQMYYNMGRSLHFRMIIYYLGLLIAKFIRPKGILHEQNEQTISRVPLVQIKMLLCCCSSLCVLNIVSLPTGLCEVCNIYKENRDSSQGHFKSMYYLFPDLPPPTFNIF